MSKMYETRVRIVDELGMARLTPQPAPSATAFVWLQVSNWDENTEAPCFCFEPPFHSRSQDASGRQVTRPSATTKLPNRDRVVFLMDCSINRNINWSRNPVVSS